MTLSRSLSWWSGLVTAALLPVLHAQQPAAMPSAQAPASTVAAAPPSAIAIVGARIIDASGNEPFEGTVVIRGDRIAEVGRSVKPPEGARIVDGKGRTVMPGLVDLVVELPKAATGATGATGVTSATDDALARAAAAYLYAGVTTIVPVSLAPAELDALRDRVLRAGVKAPRLAMPAGADRLVRGSASAAGAGGGSGAAASGGSVGGNTSADAQALNEWKQRNLTYVPELALAAPADRRAPTALLHEIGGPDGPAAIAGGSSGPTTAGSGTPAAGTSGGAAPAERWKILVEQTRRARDAGVRLALGSGAGSRMAAGAVAAAAAAAGPGATANTTTGGGAGTTGGVGADSAPSAGAASGTGGAVGAGQGTTPALGAATDAASGAASGAGAAVMPHGWSTLLGARLLVDAGLTPLQAVTAATSGGAWALGVQSDRGFLAVGQRADLVLVTGDPSANIADLERIERVFLGGDEIDRAALRTLITRPVSAPATPETTAGAAGAGAAAAMKGARGANAPGTAGRNARRGARGAAGKRGTSDLASAAEATDPSLTSSPATATAPGSPNAAAPGTPGTAPVASPTPSVTAPGGKGPGGSAPAAAAAAASPTAAAVVATDALIDDFEGQQDASTLGRAWTSAGESTSSATTVVAGRVVRGLRDHALHLTARMGDARDAHARVSVRMAQDGRPLDISRFNGLRFEARGQGRYRVIFVSRGVSDGRYHESYFSGSPLWTPVSIPFASVGQTGNGQRVTWTGRDLVEIVFEIARDPGELGWLELDNVRFY